MTPCPITQENVALTEWTDHDGGECPLEAGVVIDVRYGDGEEAFGLTLHPGHGSWAWFSSEPHDTDIIAFRPALAKPADDHIGDATEKVDWSVVGPKLVEAGLPFAELAKCLDDAHPDEMAPMFAPFNNCGQIRAFAAALAAAQPQSNGD